jgi:hypothetical protein
MRKITQLVPLVLGLALMLPAGAAAQKKQDRCVVSADNLVLVFQDVPTLSVLRKVPVRGFMYGLVGVSPAYPFEGTAVMSPEGHVRLGATIHYITSHSTIGARTDVNFAGRFGFDLDGDNLNDDLYIEFQPVACSTLYPQPY